MMAFLGTTSFSTVLHVCVNLEKLGQRSHDPDQAERLPTHEGWSSTYLAVSLDFSVLLSCSLPCDLAVGERAIDIFF